MDSTISYGPSLKPGLYGIWERDYTQSAGGSGQNAKITLVPILAGLVMQGSGCLSLASRFSAVSTLFDLAHHQRGDRSSCGSGPISLDVRVALIDKAVAPKQY